jgi:glycosyltransferase involved in cell wall biosynthesis
MHFWTFRLPRGVETLTVSLANALSERGHDVSILAAKGSQEHLVKPSPAVKLRMFPTFRYFEAKTIMPFYVLDLLRQRYDVVVAFFADYGEGCALGCVRPFTRSRLVLYLTFPVESAPHRYRAYQRFKWDTRADVVLADAHYTAQRARESLGREVRVLCSGTDPNRFVRDRSKRMDCRARLHLRDDDIVLLNVAALERRKGEWRVIEAMPTLLRACPAMHYVVLGEGGDKTILQERVHELGIGQNVHFVGTTTDLDMYYNAADIFVMLSDSEAGSIALLEAMSSELPVVVSNSGGFTEVVNEACGRLVDPSDQPAVRAAILELAGDPSLRESLGHCGRSIIKEQFSWATIAEEFERSLLEGSLETK